VEARNVNKSDNQSEKAFHSGFWHRNRAVSIWLQKPSLVKNLTPDFCSVCRGFTHAPESGIEFLAPISAACVGALQFSDAAHTHTLHWNRSVAGIGHDMPRPRHKPCLLGEDQTISPTQWHRRKIIRRKCRVAAYLDGFWDLVNILRLYDGFQIIFQNLCEVVLQLGATEVRQNLWPVWRILNATSVSERDNTHCTDSTCKLAH